MAKTLLNGVNEVLKKAGLIDSDVGVLTSLSDSGRQSYIDTAVQALNECVDQLYAEAQMSKPNVLTTSLIVMNAGTQSNGAQTNVVRYRPEFHLVDRTNSHIIFFDMSEDAYAKLILADLEQDDTGLPSYAVVSPINGDIVWNITPSAEYHNRQYRYYYDKELELTAASDTFPFKDIVFRMLVNAAYERFTYMDRKEFNVGFYNYHMSLAAKYLRQVPPRQSWNKSTTGVNPTDPMIP